VDRWISVDGHDAARLLADRFPAGMPVDQVVRIITAVASALDYALCTVRRGSGGWCSHLPSRTRRRCRRRLR
jgi:hypothetical protein